ncbi:plastid RNA polymerase sigma factor, partial [Thalassiosira pseudonana CCMP1335]
LLTFEDEKEIAYNIKSFRSVLRVRDQLVGIRQLSEPSEAQWASACSLTVEQLNDIMNKGQESRTKLITGNVGLVTLIAKRYYNMLRNLIQEGYMGIMEAAERYDPSKGFRFSTYGTHWIRQRIVRAIAESSRMIRLPVHVQATIRNINKKHEEFEATIGRSPSLPELAHEMGVSLDKLHLYQHLSRNVISLERAVDQHSPEDNRTLGDRIACTELPTPDEDAMSEALRGEVHSMLDALRDNERIVLTHRFGLDDGRPKTLKETAYGMGISIDSVRAVEAKALNRLRQPQLNYRVKDYV